MKSVVQFEHVSKQYRLGIGRATLLNSFGKMFRPSAHKPTEQEILWALRDISFTLSEGESLALIGRNGAGKSTILKLLANISRPTSGQVGIHGRVSALIELGSGFHPDLSGRENIYLNGTILGLRHHDIRRRFDEIVAFSEIERFIDTPVKRYSSGMVVRLGFAVAACIEPDILLVDEVLAVGDASFRQKCLQRIQSLVAAGTSIIFVSHNLYMVQAVCPLALYIESGQIKQRGKTAEIINMYERDLHEERARKYECAHTTEASVMTDVQILQIEVLDEDGVSQVEFVSNQAVEIHVEYEAYQTNGAANAVVRIVRTDGLTCCMMRTALDDASISVQQGKGAFAVLVKPLQLIGGTYFVDVEITNALDSVVLATGISKWFYVQGVMYSNEEGSGVYEPNRKWRQPAMPGWPNVLAPPDIVTSDL
jgi:lipopolysaccharide transport system ATP-binding protein